VTAALAADTPSMSATRTPRPPVSLAGQALPTTPRNDAATTSVPTASSANTSLPRAATTEASSLLAMQQQLSALLAAVQHPGLPLDSTRIPATGSSPRLSGTGPPGPPDDGSDDDDVGGDAEQRPRRAVAPRFRRTQRTKNVKDLDLQPFVPKAGGVRVETWIAKVDLAVEGARMAGLGDWTDEELYFVVGNKLQEDAAKSWVQINKELVGADRTWSRLKEALTLRYGERPDQAQAEWRVMSRPLLRGETYADFAAGLRDAAGQNEVQERTFLDSFYRGLSVTTRQLVKLSPTRTTLNEAVRKAMTIDDSGQNVTNGMKSIGQAWATATTPAAVHMDGTMGSLQVVPGIGSMMTTEGGSAAGATYEPEDEAFFTNPLGVYNKYYGTWIQLENRFWNGKYWAPTKKAREKRAAAREQRVAARRHLPKPERKVAKALVAMGEEDSDETESDESEEEPPLKRPKRKGKAPVRQARAMKMEDPPNSVEDVPPPPQGQCPYEQPRCFACGDSGHFARECPDPVKKAKNDAWLAQRRAKPRTSGNDERA